MSVTTIDASAVARLFLAGARQLKAEKDYINELNVFPVPDGDTGTNMTLTILSAAREVAQLPEDAPMKDIAKAISSGSLRGARGNSGVILSQLLRGFTKGIQDYEELDTKILAAAFERGKETAYKAVMKPKEGTILTVARELAEEAQIAAEETDDLEVFSTRVFERAKESLASTPDLLPVLKEAGVVDSGGQGLVEIMHGIIDHFYDDFIDMSFLEEGMSESSANVRVGGAKPNITEQELTFGYCTEFIIKTEKEFTEQDETKLKDYLNSIGDSLVCVVDEDLVKIHVHTDHPGNAFEKGLTYGQLTSMKVDNLREEHQEVLFKRSKYDKKEETPQEEKEIGFIVISSGDGLSEIFRELGADYIIEGGQTMNPSTEDILAAAEKVNARHLFVLPNNKNIILAANQAKDLIEGKEIHVIPTTTIPQGISVLINYLPDNDAQTNEKNMVEGLSLIKSGQVTYAVRDTSIDGKEIHEGDIMSIGDAGLLCVGQELKDVMLETIEKMVDDDTEIISLYYGEDVKEEDAEALVAALEEIYEDYDIDMRRGGQPIYYYFISAE